MRGNVNIIYTGSKANSLDMRGISRASVTMNDAVFNSSGFYYDVGNCTLTLNGNSRYNSSSGVYNLVYSDIYFNDSSSANLTAPQSCCGVGIYMQSAQTRLNISSSKPFFEGWYSYDAKIKAVDGAVISLSSGRFTAESDTDIKISGQVAELPSPQFSKDAAANVENDETYKSVMDDFAAYIQACRDNRTPNKVSDTQYSDILSQYDSLIKDSSYKGVNLLQNQDLKVTFNESRSAWLDVKGKDASSAALGLTTTEWNSKEDIEKSIEELTAAMNQIRTMSAELGSYYNIVLNRQDFTENLINVLEEGADKLTLADMNEESANMLALQTRQQLATNSLSLASQAAQSILRLF